MQVAVFNKEGKDTGRKVELADAFFGIEPNEHAVYLDVRQHLANRRQGTHKAKERSEIARTSKKFFRQKGTGNARVGSLRSPVQRGGGTVFGPRPRNYSFKLNRKLKVLARKSALSQKLAADRLKVLEPLTMDKPSTKDFFLMLKALGVSDKKNLVVTGESNKALYLSSRNLPGSFVLTASEINTYSVVNAQNVFLTEDALEKLQIVLS